MNEPASLARRAARVVSVLAVAVLLGHVVQTLSANSSRGASDTAVVTDQPKAIVPVVAGPESALAPLGQTVPAQITASADPVVAAPAAAILDDGKPAAATMQASALFPVPATSAPQAGAPLQVALADPAEGSPAATPAIRAAAEPELSIVPKAMEPLLSPSADCKQEMDLAVLADAIIEITLLAPCHPAERLVIRHGGLTITAKSTADGSVFLKVPALQADGKVSLRFADGTEISGAVPVPDLAALKRFAVQWIASDTFSVNAFEGGANYGDVGHISAANPGKLPLTGTTGGGYLMILGDAQTQPAMLAEVYTYPSKAATPVEISVEAEVTRQTCGRELLGEVITSENGVDTARDLSMAMPDCTALGDILVMKNPRSDLTLAAAN